MLRRGATTTSTPPARRAVAADARWRTSPQVSAAIVLASSSRRAKTPAPLQLARQAARVARAVAGATRRTPRNPLA